MPLGCKYSLDQRNSREFNFVHIWRWKLAPQKTKSSTSYLENLALKSGFQWQAKLPTNQSEAQVINPQSALD